MKTTHNGQGRPSIDQKIILGYQYRRLSTGSIEYYIGPAGRLPTAFAPQENRRKLTGFFRVYFDDNVRLLRTLLVCELGKNLTCRKMNDQQVFSRCLNGFSGRPKWIKALPLRHRLSFFFQLTVFGRGVERWTFVTV